MFRLMAALCLFVTGMAAAGVRVSVHGVMGDKALISMNGNAPRVMRAGETIEGVHLLAVGADKVEIAYAGRRHVVSIGQGGYVGSGNTAVARAVLNADAGGHFMAEGLVNGVPVRFMLDTGASLVTLPTSVARRVGVNLTQAPTVIVNTANGQARAQRVTLNTVKVGGIGVNLVEAMVMDDAALPLPLLGMSFLNRTNLQREGDSLVLMQRY